MLGPAGASPLCGDCKVKNIPSFILDPGLEPLLTGFKTGHKEGRDGKGDDGVTFLGKC